MRALPVASRRLSAATFLPRTVVPRRTITPALSARPSIPRQQYATAATATATTTTTTDLHDTIGSSNLDWKISPMATARKVHLSPTTDTGVWSTGITEESAKTASEVLQEDLEKHHVYFNNMGFHSEFAQYGKQRRKRWENEHGAEYDTILDHIVHHILTIYALGATPAEIRAAYERNKTYQRPPLPVKEDVVQSLYDKTRFKEELGKERNYPNFLEFFQREIEKRGVDGVLKEYVFREPGNTDECADSMLVRLFGGLLHPIIHLGFAIEFNQPAIIAEALAQTAIHEDWTGPRFLHPAEKVAGGIGIPGKKTMLELLEESRADSKLANSVHWEDGNKLRDGVLKRAPDEMINLAAQFTVSEEQISEKFAEMVDISGRLYQTRMSWYGGMLMVPVYYTSAAQRASKTVKFDFFYIHAVNSSIFYNKILALPFLDLQTKLRLLEWKGRMDLILYVSRGAPQLHLDEISGYPISNDWNTIITQSNKHAHDDGHLSKLVRALKNAEENVCAPFEAQAQEKGLKITGDMWLKIANMVNDSVKGKGEHQMWVRSTGFDEAWTQFEDRAHL